MTQNRKEGVLLIYNATKLPYLLSILNINAKIVRELARATLLLVSLKDSGFGQSVLYSLSDLCVLGEVLLWGCNCF